MKLSRKSSPSLMFRNFTGRKEVKSISLTLIARTGSSPGGRVMLGIEAKRDHYVFDSFDNPAFIQVVDGVLGVLSSYSFSIPSSSLRTLLGFSPEDNVAGTYVRNFYNFVECHSGFVHCGWENYKPSLSFNSCRFIFNPHLHGRDWSVPVDLANLGIYHSMFAQRRVRS